MSLVFLSWPTICQTVASTLTASDDMMEIQTSILFLLAVHSLQRSHPQAHRITAPNRPGHAQYRVWLPGWLSRSVISRFTYP